MLQTNNSNNVNCAHPCTFRGLCVDCGSNLQNFDSYEKKESLDWLNLPGFEAHQSYLIENLYEDDNERLIQQKKLRLVLDLDETLIHTKKVSKNEHIEEDLMDIVEHIEESFVEEFYETQQQQIHFQSESFFSYKEEIPHDTFQLGNTWYRVLLRPGVENFLSEVSKDFELYVYTHGTTEYCHKVLKFLKKRMDFLGLPFNLQAIHSRKTQKRFKKNLKKMYCKRSISVIIDDNPNAWSLEDQNSILTVTPFKGDSNDKELIYLYQYLINVHGLFFETTSTKPDVRRVLAKMLND
eukprot:gene5455-9268_t